jgi:hypothetical protein
MRAPDTGSTTFPEARRSSFFFAVAIKGSQPGDIALAKKIASELEV